ncbi:Hypothetical protein SAMN02745117_00325 [Lampropedia hyalina DSM 16112]|uniref:DUF2271 domain-containing protein n=1 Tax=Lampropedia hyalina DSM 16112 TaxID=1122156 RepID=A0A1M4TQN0_9BURK|nr:DUF2271 domain-containing protein [Lampropedia hyalina]SHE46738.1 Hypothetical protein SAMN02745117_00325 [Lampropedia hyalina DSM 16112]
MCPDSTPADPASRTLRHQPDAPCGSSVTQRASVVIAATLAAWAIPAQSASLAVDITLPEIQTATYYRPYLAAWIEQAEGQQVVSTLAVWYDTRLRDNLGKGWLRDLRTWWRKAGQTLELPADGISGATRAPGTHTLHLAADHATLRQLAHGQYHIAVEVAREHGGRELLRVPFTWAGTASTAATASADGQSELAQITVRIQP